MTTKKVLKPRYFISPKASEGETWAGALGSCEVADSETGEMVTRRTIDTGEAVMVLPTHASLMQMLSDLPDGSTVELEYHGLVGPNMRGKPSAKWSGTLLD